MTYVYIELDVLPGTGMVGS